MILCFFFFWTYDHIIFICEPETFILYSHLWKVYLFNNSSAPYVLFHLFSWVCYRINFLSKVCYSCRLSHGIVILRLICFDDGLSLEVVMMLLTRITIIISIQLYTKQRARTQVLASLIASTTQLPWEITYWYLSVW